MRILVTGGAGFIGANLLHHLVFCHPEHHFVNLDALTYAANPQSLEPLEGLANYEFLHGDLTERAFVDETIGKHEPDWVIHLAAESHVDRSIEAPARFVETNVLGTFHLLEACRKLAMTRPLLFHHVSTDEVYGSLTTGLFTEETRYDPSSPYSASKAASDHLVRAYHRTYGLSVKITNCSNNYGPYQSPEKLIPLMIHNALQGRALPVYGTGENVRDWLYVKDHCEAIWLVLEKGATGRTYNVGGASEVRNIDLVRKLCHILSEETGRPAREFSDLITFVTDRPGHDLRYGIDASRLHSELGWCPRVSLDEGLRSTVRWYLEHPHWIALSAKRLASANPEAPR